MLKLNINFKILAYVDGGEWDVNQNFCFVCFKVTFHRLLPTKGRGFVKIKENGRHNLKTYEKNLKYR